MDELTAALEGDRVREMFGSGTACVVCPVSDILYKGQVRPAALTPCHFPAFPATSVTFLVCA
jgi:hypothetical protein